MDDVHVYRLYIVLLETQRHDIMCSFRVDPVL